MQCTDLVSAHVFVYFTIRLLARNATSYKQLLCLVVETRGKPRVTLD